MLNNERFKYLKNFVYIIEKWNNTWCIENIDVSHIYPKIENSYDNYTEDTVRFKQQEKINKLTKRIFNKVDKFTGVQKQTEDFAWIYTFDKEGKIISIKCYDKNDDLLFVKKLTEQNVYEIRNVNEKLIWKQIEMQGNPVLQQSIYYGSDDSILVSKSECFLNEDGKCKEFLQYNSQGLL